MFSWSATEQRGRSGRSACPHTRFPSTTPHRCCLGLSPSRRRVYEKLAAEEGLLHHLESGVRLASRESAPSAASTLPMRSATSRIPFMTCARHAGRDRAVSAERMARPAWAGVKAATSDCSLSVSERSSLHLRSRDYPRTIQDNGRPMKSTVIVCNAFAGKGGRSLARLLKFKGRRTRPSKPVFGALLRRFRDVTSPLSQPIDNRGLVVEQLRATSAMAVGSLRRYDARHQFSYRRRNDADRRAALPHGPASEKRSDHRDDSDADIATTANLSARSRSFAPRSLVYIVPNRSSLLRVRSLAAGPGSDCLRPGCPKAQADGRSPTIDHLALASS